MLQTPQMKMDSLIRLEFAEWAASSGRLGSQETVIPDEEKESIERFQLKIMNKIIAESRSGVRGFISPDSPRPRRECRKSCQPLDKRVSLKR